MSSEDTQGPVVRVPSFEGPLDLLLFLIRKNEINIYDIPIGAITEQYLAYMAYAVRVDLENITDFYVMAATLIYIKSRMLLPMEESDDEEFDDPRKELVERLIEYQRYRKLTELMEERQEEAELDLLRPAKQRSLPFPEGDDTWQDLDPWALFEHFAAIMSNLGAERLIELYEEVSINEKVALIEEYLEDREEFDFAELIKRGDSVLELVCAFLALLELTKTRRISIQQNRLFGDIRIRRSPHGA
jgi:segregation and condensation protein A